MAMDTDMVRAWNTIPRRPEAARCLCWSVLGVLAVGALALPGVAAAQSLRVTPTLTTELTWTDNVDAEPNGRDDWILEVTPGISVSRTAGRMTGGLSARLRNLMYFNESDENTSFVSLNGSGSFEAIEDLLFIDASAAITRNNLLTFSGAGSRGSTQRRFGRRDPNLVHHAPARIGSGFRRGRAWVGALFLARSQLQ